jgi:hypothetical protein
MGGTLARQSPRRRDPRQAAAGRLHGLGAHGASGRPHRRTSLPKQRAGSRGSSLRAGRRTRRRTVHRARWPPDTPSRPQGPAPSRTARRTGGPPDSRPHTSDKWCSCQVAAANTTTAIALPALHSASRIVNPLRPADPNCVPSTPLLSQERAHLVFGPDIASHALSAAAVEHRLGGNLQRPRIVSVDNAHNGKRGSGSQWRWPRQIDGTGRCSCATDHRHAGAPARRLRAACRLSHGLVHVRAERSLLVR